MGGRGRTGDRERRGRRGERGLTRVWGGEVGGGERRDRSRGWVRRGRRWGELGRGRARRGRRWEEERQEVGRGEARVEGGGAGVGERKDRR